MVTWQILRAYCLLDAGEPTVLFLWGSPCPAQYKPPAYAQLTTQDQGLSSELSSYMSQKHGTGFNHILLEVQRQHVGIKAQVGPNGEMVVAVTILESTLALIKCPEHVTWGSVNSDQGTS